MGLVQYVATDVEIGYSRTKAGEHLGISKSQTMAFASCQL